MRLCCNFSRCNDFRDRMTNRFTCVCMKCCTKSRIRSSFSFTVCVSCFFLLPLFSSTPPPAFYCDAQRLPEPWPQFQSRFSDIRNTQRAAAAAAARDAAAAKMDRLLASIDSASGSGAADREEVDGGGEHSGGDAAAAENDGTAASDHESSESSAKRPKIAHASSSSSSSSPSVCDSV
jgi:hypothetical protein